MTDRPLKYHIDGHDIGVIVCRSCLFEIFDARTPEDPPATVEVKDAEPDERCTCGGAF